jgi:hypothetical protein
MSLKSGYLKIYRGEKMRKEWKNEQWCYEHRQAAGQFTQLSLVQLQELLQDAGRRVEMVETQTVQLNKEMTLASNCSLEEAFCISPNWTLQKPVWPQTPEALLEPEGSFWSLPDKEDQIRLTV